MIRKIVTAFLGIRPRRMPETYSKMAGCFESFIRLAARTA
jgi:hypothetical protein